MAKTERSHPVRSRRRRATALGAALLVGATTLAACSTEDEPEPGPSTSAAPGPTVINFAVYGAAPVVAAYTQIAADFTAENPDVVVNVQPYSSHAQAKAKMAEAEEMPDVFLTERSDLAALSENELTQPVDNLLAERGVDFGDGFQREALEAFSHDSSLQCMPTDTSPLVVYYNKRRLDLDSLALPGEREVGPDSGWTMEQFTRAARETSRGKVRGVYVEPSLEQVSPFVWSGGGEVTDSVTEPTTLTLSEGDSPAALEELLELVRDPSVTFSQEEIDRASAVDRFKVGRLTMLLGYRDLTPGLRQQPNLDFDVMPLPRIGSRATTGTLHGLCISADTEAEKAAADFIAYTVGDEPTAMLAGTGFVTPTNLDVANSDTFIQPDRRPASSQVFTSATRYIRQLPIGDAWDAVSSLAQRQLTRLFYDPVIDPLEERLTTIDERSALIFERYAEPEEGEESESPTASPSGSPTASPAD